MILVNSNRLRGSVIEFTFKHKSRKLGKQIFTVNAINAENAKTKVMKELSKQYKKLKKFGNPVKQFDPISVK